MTTLTGPGSGRKAGPGRPKGSKNVSIVNKTQVFRDAVTPDKVRAVEERLYSLIHRDDIKTSECISAAALYLKYAIHSADVELIAEMEAEKPSPEAMAKAMALISSHKGE